MSTSLTHLSGSAAQLPPTLPAEVRAAAMAAATGEPVRTLLTEELADLLIATLPGLAFLLGHSRQFVEQPDIEAMAEAVAAEIHLSFSRLSWAEISYALRRGVSGKWRRDEKEVLLVSLDHITHWLTCYCRELRTSAHLALQALPAPTVTPPRIDYVGSVVGYLAQAKAGELPIDFELDMGNVLYTWLKAAHAFSGFRTAEQYAQMQQQETDRMLAVQLPESGAARREYTSFVSALAATGELPDTHPLSRSVVNACKKRLLREWLQHHAQAATDIVDFLSQRQAA